MPKSSKCCSTRIHSGHPSKQKCTTSFHNSDVLLNVGSFSASGDLNVNSDLLEDIGHCQLELKILVDTTVHSKSFLSALDDCCQLSDALDISPVLDGGDDSDCKQQSFERIWTLEERQYDIEDEEFWNHIQSQTKGVHEFDLLSITFT